MNYCVEWSAVGINKDDSKELRLFAPADDKIMHTWIAFWAFLHIWHDQQHEAALCDFFPFLKINTDTLIGHYIIYTARHNIPDTRIFLAQSYYIFLSLIITTNDSLSSLQNLKSPSTKNCVFSTCYLKCICIFIDFGFLIEEKE